MGSSEEKEELRSKRGASSSSFGTRFSQMHKEVSEFSLPHSEEKYSSKKTASRRGEEKEEKRMLSRKPEAEEEERASSSVVESSSSSSTSPLTSDSEEEAVPSFGFSRRNEKKKGLKKNAFPQKKREF